jgi:hypothetical protein
VQDLFHAQRADAVYGSTAFTAAALAGPAVGGGTLR